MKKVLTFLLLIVVATTLSAQSIYTPAMLTQIGVSEEGIQEVQDIMADTESLIREYTAELNIVKAQLERELLNEDPDMDQVRALIEESLSWRSESEIARVQQRIRIRQELGSENWENLLRLQERIQQQNKTATQNQQSNSGSGSNNSNDAGSNSGENSNNGSTGTRNR